MARASDTFSVSCMSSRSVSSISMWGASDRPPTRGAPCVHVRATERGRTDRFSSVLFVVQWAVTCSGEAISFLNCVCAS
jgi:hypothetical protein